MAQESLQVKDTLIVFVKDELVIFNFSKTTGWYVGDNRGSMEIPQFSSFAKVNQEFHG